MYTCPMHREITSDKSGNCPKCGMKLVLMSSLVKKSKITLYKPLIIMIGLILLVTITLSVKDFVDGYFSLNSSMAYFMAGFFLVFSGFKFLDLAGFADGYQTYDLFAKRIYHYGYVYPFIELALGVGYILVPDFLVLNLVTAVVMSFSGLGVLIEKSKKKTIQCACLGTIFKLPLTNITLIEDFGMVVMALLMILI